eukprot:COSAG01_NODE_4951_length_4594_cov_8.087430_2_plen_154_part_00
MSQTDVLDVTNEWGRKGVEVHACFCKVTSQYSIHSTFHSLHLIVIEPQMWGCTYTVKCAWKGDFARIGGARMGGEGSTSYSLAVCDTILQYSVTNRARQCKCILHGGHTHTHTHTHNKFFNIPACSDEFLPALIRAALNLPVCDTYLFINTVD